MMLFGLAAIGMQVPVLQAQQPPPMPPPPPPATMRTLPAPRPAPAIPVAPAVSQSVTAQTGAVQIVGGQPPTFPPVVSQTPAALPGTDNPKIQFASTVYDFEKVRSGDPVKYTFIFTNVGTGTLHINGVQPQCGCTAAGEWTKQVEPGNTGEIPIQFNTSSYHGQVFKTITVSCNDKLQPAVILQLKGNIWKPIDYIPPYTVMNILPDMASASASVKIVNNLEEPLDVWGPECAYKGFETQLITNKPGKEYQLTIKATPPLAAGTLSGKVGLSCSMTNSSKLEVPFWANVQAPIAVYPPQVMLQSGPLANKASPAVTIQNNTTNALKLSDPKVDLPGVDVDFKELQPGRIFTAQLTFPAGFELKPGEQPALTFKTTHPQTPELRIPIVQSRPFAPAVAPAVNPLQSKLVPAKLPPEKTIPPQRLPAPVAQ